MATNLITYRLTETPDLSMDKYSPLGIDGVDSVLSRLDAFVRQMGQMLHIEKASMHLFYVYDPKLGINEGLKVYLAWKSDNKESLITINTILPHMPLSSVFRLEHCLGKELKQWSFAQMATLCKRERIVSVVKNDTNVESDFYSVSDLKANEDCRLMDMINMMIALGNASGTPCAVRVDLYAGDEADSTRAAFKPVLRRLHELNDNVSPIITDIRSHMNRDSSVNTLIREYEGWQDSLDAECHFRMNVYAFGATRDLARLILTAIQAEAVSDGNCDILGVTVQNPVDLFERLGDEEEAIPYNRRKNGYAMAPANMRDWSTTYIWKECAAFFRLPLPLEGEILPMRRESDPPLPKKNKTGQPKASILLAKDDAGRDVVYPVSLLAKHALICGVPGSGKTFTMLHLTTSLWKQHGIPFLVLEPAKKEYRAIFNDPEMKDVYLFSPRVGTDFPLHINPFEFPYGMVLSEHISRLVSVFAGTFNMGHSTEYILDEAIQNAYYSLGWKQDTVNNGSLPYPSLKEVYSRMEKEIKQKSYSSDMRGDIQAFLEVRVGGLMKRDAGLIYDVKSSTIKPEEWLKIPAIIEMEALGDQARNFLTLLLCTLIYESLRVAPYADLDRFPDLRHVLFIEEAHNIIAPNAQQQSSDHVDSKVSATEILVKMLAEVRALREGIVIADQLPSALAPQVLKNTGTKLVQRMTAKDDRDYICATMRATAAQNNELVAYETGKALMFFEGLLRPFRAKIEKWGFKDAPDDYAIPKDDKQLSELLHGRKAYFDRVCSRSLCILYERYINQKKDSLQKCKGQYFAFIQLKKENLLTEKELTSIRKIFNDACVAYFLAGNTCNALLEKAKKHMSPEEYSSMKEKEKELINQEDSERINEWHVKINAIM